MEVRKNVLDLSCNCFVASSGIQFCLLLSVIARPRPALWDRERLAEHEQSEDERTLLGIDLNGKRKTDHGD